MATLIFQFSKMYDFMKTPFDLNKPVAIGSDHAGFEYKEDLISFLEAKGLTYHDFGTHSVELVRLTLAAVSEIDVVAKSFCRTLNPDGMFKNIDHYREGIMTRYPGFATMKITVPRYGLVFEPWACWASVPPTG